MEDNISLYPEDYQDNGDPTGNLLAGNGSPSDFVSATGGPGNPYVLNQSPFDVLTNGAVTSRPTTTGHGTVTTTTAPGWQSLLSGIVGGATQAAGTIAPLVNGRPSTKPAAAKSPNAMYIALAAGAAIIGGFFLLRKGR